MLDAAGTAQVRVGSQRLLKQTEPSKRVLKRPRLPGVVKQAGSKSLGDEFLAAEFEFEACGCDRERVNIILLRQVRHRGKIASKV